MKTPFLTLGILCGMSVCGTAAAQSTVGIPSFTASVYPISGISKVHVVVTKEFGKKFSLTFRDEKNYFLYQDKMEKRCTQHRFVLNLSQLENGKYYIDLSDGKTPVVTKIIIKEEAILSKPISSTQIVCLDSEKRKTTPIGGN